MGWEKGEDGPAVRLSFKSDLERRREGGKEVGEGKEREGGMGGRFSWMDSSRAALGEPSSQNQSSEG